MMAVSGVTGSTSSATTSSLTSSSTGIADNFQSFLSILTTQLKNQNPLDPMNTDAFTQQLVQFSQVEQQLKTNSFLEALVNASTTSQNSSSNAMSLIGKEVTVKTTASELKGGAANWMFSASAKSDAATITVKDAKGNTVFETTKPVLSGENRFVWDGKASDGSTAPDGSYSISVAGKDVSGGAISIDTQMAGKVDGVDLTGTEPYLMVGTARISVSSVVSVRAL
jgi:flagellar basal-body rod modification protein FlgD